MTRTFIAAALAGALAADAAATGPVARVEPSTNRLTLELTIDRGPCSSDRGRLERVGGQIQMPLLPAGPFHRVDLDSVQLRVFATGPQVEFHGVGRLDDQPYGTSLATAAITGIPSIGSRVRYSFEVQTWNVLVDEAAMQKLAWPREWPDDVKDALGDQLAIQATDGIFAEVVERVTNGRLKLVPPWLAAKELTRYAVRNVNVLEQEVDCGCGNMVGYERCQVTLTGASTAARLGRATRADLVAVCVATLRAAGIPARPVIGATSGGDAPGERLVVWGELFMPEAGWVPFDPDELRSQSLHARDVRAPWKGFGHVEDLNARLPIAWEFVPAASHKPRPRDDRPIVVGGWGHTMGTRLPMWDYTHTRVDIDEVRKLTRH